MKKNHRWMRRIPCQVKINCDGTFAYDGMLTGTGVVVKNSDNAVIGAMAKRKKPCISVALVENSGYF